MLDELWKDLRILAAHRNVSVNFLIHEFLEKALKKEYSHDGSNKAGRNDKNLLVNH